MIDEDHLARQTAGDMDLQQELLTLFLMQMEDLKHGLNAYAVASGPTILEPLLLSLHRIRGAAAAVGARDLGASLSHAEAAIERDPASRSVLDPLRAEVNAACDALANLIAARKRAGLAKGCESR